MNIKEKIIANDKEHLMLLIKEEINLNGLQCDLNHIDTSLIIDMTYMFFYESAFNGNISHWNTSNVTEMIGMFYDSKFNGDISKWNTSNVNNMNSMFLESAFNGNISHWDVSNVTEMDSIFFNCVGEKPWWAIEDNDKRKVAINNYQLMQKLDNKLIQKTETISHKKMKI